MNDYDNNLRKKLKELDLSTLDALKISLSLSKFFIEFMAYHDIEPNDFMEFCIKQSPDFNKNDVVYILLKMYHLFDIQPKN